MRTTQDILTGQKFRWNETLTVGGVVVPARITSRSSTYLHPSRVPPTLLAELNSPQESK